MSSRSRTGLTVEGMRFQWGPLGPLTFLCAVVLLMSGTAAPVLADDPPPPQRAAPAPRGALQAVPGGASYNELIAYANDTAQEMGALQQQAPAVAQQRDAALVELSTLAALAQRPTSVRDRLVRDALRLSSRSARTWPTTLTPEQRESAEDMRALRSALRQRYDDLQAQVDALAPYLAIAPADGPWMSPAQGPVTQGFGPVQFSLEPPRRYGGVYYAHFHEGIDIGAEMYSPVVAAAPGRVVFADRVSDGAVVVLIAHPGGLVSLYAHLDGRIAPPRVAAGDDVRLGQIIGAVGMTGMTTGPHLHFAVWREGELIDPATMFAR